VARGGRIDKHPGDGSDTSKDEGARRREIDVPTQMKRIVPWSSQMWPCRSISATIVSREVMHTSLGRRHRERNALQRIRAYAGEGAPDESSPRATYTSASSRDVRGTQGAGLARKCRPIRIRTPVEFASVRNEAQTLATAAVQSRLMNWRCRPQPVVTPRPL
jgi:hypothetical protein